MIDEAGPYHDGELTLQWATGERADGVRNGRGVVDRVISGAVGFIARQELAVVATIDRDGQPWCSALVGPAGSFTVLDPSTLTLDPRAATTSDDPLWNNLRDDPRVGLLFIEMESRRRYRVNGRAAGVDANALVIRVSEAYPNCPKYIQRRHVVVESAHHDTTAVYAGTRLGPRQHAIIASADTFFVASANPHGHLDASHRGGRPGFVRADGDALWIPDYAGNSMFNTLGNLAVHPRAGLLFVDFADGETLQLTGTADIHLDADHDDTGGTGRAWTFTTTAWRHSRLTATLRAELLDSSPHNP